MARRATCDAGRLIWEEKHLGRHRPRAGRMLAASLHQAITDELLTRLEFYELWLRPETLHAGRIRVAPLTAVLSFLRKEDDDVYADVMERAGRYAADWTVSELAPLRRSFIQGAPTWLRRRLVSCP